MNLEELASTFPADKDGFKHVILGAQLSGKTCASKYLCQELHLYGYLPVLLNGSDITNNIRPETLSKIVDEKISEQYKTPFLSSTKSDLIVIVIDDYHKVTKSNPKYWHATNTNLYSLYKNFVFIGSSLMLIENFGKRDPFDGFEQFGLLEFGPKLRHEIVNKWNTLGSANNFIDRNEILRKNDSALNQIKAIIGKNYVPSYPFYILTILQALESGNANNPSYSVHGFYYELLINDALYLAVKDKKEISLYHNIMTELSFNMFELQVKELSFKEFDDFFNLFCEKYDISYSKEKLLNCLSEANLIKLNSSIHLPENYIYYFFVAKYLANHIAELEVKQIISKMAERIFRKEFSSILMFLTHLSKDKFIIEELIKQSEKLFATYTPLKLDNDVDKINELIESIPKQVIQHVDVMETREIELQEEEEKERLEKELRDQKNGYDEVQLNDDISNIDFLARLTKALKTIDLLGQVAKKHWGELDGKVKEKLINETYMLGLRTLGFYIDSLSNNAEAIAGYVQDQVLRKHVKDRFEMHRSIEKFTRDIIFKLSFMSSWGIIKRVSNAVGYDKLENTFKKILESNGYNSVKLIDFSIKLGYKNLPFDLVEECEKDMKKNKLCMVLLQNLVIDYLYMYDVSYKDKSRICSVLGIDISNQHLISATSKVKK